MTNPLGRSVALVLTALLTVTLTATLTGCGSEGASPSSAPTVAPAPLDVVGDVLPAGSWVLVDFYGSGTSQGELQLNNADGAEAKINWRKADQFQSYVDDRADLGADKPLVVLGRASRMYTYSADDHTVIRPVAGRAFLEIRVDGADEAAFRTFVASLGAVTPEQWTAAVEAAGLKADAKGDSSS
jgi:hypothetical protein